MQWCRVISKAGWLTAISLAIFVPLHAQDAQEEAYAISEEYFVGLTPLSPSVWDARSVETQTESQLRDYVFREAYLVEANNTYLNREGKMFTIPTDDLTTTQRRILSPSQRIEEEESRRNYAETVTGVVVNKGVPEYMLQLLGLQKLREGVKKIEKAVAVDVSLGTIAPNARRAQAWKFKTAFLPFQRSYKLTLTDNTYSWDLQGGWTSSKGDYLFTTLSARWGRFLQVNTYQVFTNTAYSSLSFFINPNMSVSASIRREFKDNPDTEDNLYESVGYSYIF